MSAPGIGHNSDVGGIAAGVLKSIIERYERLDEEIKGLRDDQKDIMAEAKGQGFDAKIIREVIRLRKMDKAEREERETLLDLYMHATGMLD